MGLRDKLTGSSEENEEEEKGHERLDLKQYEGDLEEVRMEVYFAEVKGQRGILKIKDIVEDGDMVIIELASLKENLHNPNRVIDDLRDLAHRIGGDIVQKGDKQVIITPKGVEINREKVVG